MADEAAAPRPRLVVTNHDPAFLELLQLLLADEGYEALVPPKLDEPYPFIKEVRPAAVVLDLPFRQETETLAVLDALRLDPATAALPVVVCTTSPGALDGLARREGEGLYVLAKPFDLERLLAVLATALRRAPAPPTRRVAAAAAPDRARRRGAFCTSAARCARSRRGSPPGPGGGPLSPSTDQGRPPPYPLTVQVPCRGGGGGGAASLGVTPAAPLGAGSAPPPVIGAGDRTRTPPGARVRPARAAPG